MTDTLLRLALTSLLVMSLAACASDGGDKDVSVARYDQGPYSDQKLVCRREFKSGTHIKHTKCRTVRTMEAEQEAAFRFLQVAQKPEPGLVAPAGGGGGGGQFVPHGC